MTLEYTPGVRYRMPTVFGPAPGPRQKADGTPWSAAEAGTMNAHWMTVAYRSERIALEALLPPGFSLRGEPVVHVSLAFFRNLYWLAGRGYGILKVDLPVTYAGKSEIIDGAFCPAIWEGMPDAIMTGREELGFPKLFADIPELSLDMDEGRAGGEASWLDFKFIELALQGLEPADTLGNTRLPGPGGADLFFKYMPRTGPSGSGGTDLAYVTTSAPLPGAEKTVSPIDFGGTDFRRWTGTGGNVKWHRASFEQLPTTFHIVNGLAALPMREVVNVELIQFSGPGLAVSANALRPVQAA